MTKPLWGVSPFAGFNPGDIIHTKAGDTFTIEEKTMAKRFGKKERKLLKRYGKMPGKKRRAGRSMAASAATYLSVTERELAVMYTNGTKEEREEAKTALQAAASRDDSGIEHFAKKKKAGEFSDWFPAFLECFREFAPIFINML